jgi:heat shock protein HtpX
MMGVEIVDQSSQFTDLVYTVHNLAKRAGLPKMPEVGIYNSPDVNAFATGPSKSNSLVAVSTGLLEKMSKEEVEGVLAHEVAHIANGDMVTTTILQGILNAFVMFLAHIVMHIIDQFTRDENGRGGLGMFARFFVYNILQTVFGFAAAFVSSYFSRTREFRADEGGARLAGKQKMKMALQKLASQYENLTDPKEQAAFKTMQISSKRMSMMQLLSTHPPLEKRIEALDRLAIS